MRAPQVGKQRSASGAFSLSRNLPRLKMPLSAAGFSVSRPKPQIGRPGKSMAGTLLKKSSGRQVVESSSGRENLDDPTTT